MKLQATNFFKTLSTRLTLALIAIVIVVGIAVYFSSQAGMSSYYEELNQKINFSIAMYVTDEYQLIQQDGEDANTEALQALAQTAMIINPGVEVYVLDIDGNIIGHNFPPESIQHNKVPLAPLLDFIAGETQYPLRNIDPRNSITKKVFSASPIRHNDKLQGYLYVVLAGEVFDNIELSIKNSYSRKRLLISIATIIVAALICGIVIFKLLVRRLNILSLRMQSFSEQELTTFGLNTNNQENKKPRDELDLLTSNFESLTKKITEQIEMLHETDKIKRELISNVSHDLRTPLSSIQGYLETLLIKNESLTESQRLKYLKTAMQSSRRLGLLIGDLFELSKLETRQIQINIESFSLSELIYDTVQEFQLEFESKKINIEIQTEKNSALVYADISLIQRVFENLIRNAIAYTPENGKVMLKVEAIEANDNIIVSVSDTGSGINPEDLPFIFDRFYSNPNHSRNDVISTGLGLSIVKRILELHGSKISVESQPNQGTRFEFCLSTSTLAA